MKKVFVILYSLIGVAFVAGFAFIIFLMVGISGDPPRQESYTQNVPAEYKLYPNEEVNLSPELLSDYIAVNELSFSGKSFAEFNENWYNPDDGTYCLYNKYYINNNACAEEKDKDSYCYYFGRDVSNPEFIFAVSVDYSNQQWLVKKGYQFPKVGADTVKNILFMPMEHENYMDAFSPDRLHRLNYSAAVLVEDETLKEKIVNDYLDEEFDYGYISSYGIVDSTQRYMILVEFEDSVVYQCIGEI